MDTQLDTIVGELKENHILGEYGSEGAGPLVIALGALHGNEHSGVIAARRVLEELALHRPAVHGRFLALLGNRTAHSHGIRYVGRDLNRMWTAERVAGIRECSREELRHAEDIEMYELTRLLDAANRRTAGHITLLDLHTSSAPSEPFFAVANDMSAKRIARSTGIVEILGISEYLRGMLVEHGTRMGWSALAFEAGQHTAPESVDRHEAMIWHTLVATGVISGEAMPEQVKQRCEEMACGEEGGGRALKIVYRHALQPGDAYEMGPGYQNFTPVREGEVLGHDWRGEVHCPMDGLIFLPLYQSVGQEAFFIVREALISQTV